MDILYKKVNMQQSKGPFAYLYKGTQYLNIQDYIIFVHYNKMNYSMNSSPPPKKRRPN